MGTGECLTVAVLAACVAGDEGISTGACREVLCEADNGQRDHHQQGGEVSVTLQRQQLIQQPV